MSKYLPQFSANRNSLVKLCTVCNSSSIVLAGYFTILPLCLIVKLIAATCLGIGQIRSFTVHVVQCYTELELSEVLTIALQ